MRKRCLSHKIEPKPGVKIVPVEKLACDSKYFETRYNRLTSLFCVAKDKTPY